MSDDDLQNAQVAFSKAVRAVDDIELGDLSKFKIEKLKALQNDLDDWKNNFESLRTGGDDE